MVDNRWIKQIDINKLNDLVIANESFTTKQLWEVMDYVGQCQVPLIEPSGGFDIRKYTGHYELKIEDEISLKVFALNTVVDCCIEQAEQKAKAEERERIVKLIESDFRFSDTEWWEIVEAIKEKEAEDGVR